MSSSTVRPWQISSKYVYLALGVMALVVLGMFNPSDYWFWPKCPVKLLTGLNCPACGIQRFLHAFLKGDFSEACHYNFYLIYALPFALANVLCYYLPQVRLKEKLQDVLECKWSLYFYVASFLLWFVVINLLKI